MSSCLSSRATCGFNLEHMIKWPSCTSTSRTTTTSSNSSSPSSTLSESTNSPIAISTRKTRKPRKRPNQTYNEAAALLSMACPSIFTTKHLIKSTTNLQILSKHNHSFFNEPPELIENQELNTEKPFSWKESKVGNSCQKAEEVEKNCKYVELSDGCLDDIDTDSILGEEIEQGIDSIMGDSNSIQENIGYDLSRTSYYGYPIGLGFGIRNGVRALRYDNDRNWWCSPSPMVDVSQAVVEGDCQKLSVGKKNKNRKKKKKVEELMKSEPEFGHLSIGNGDRLMLKLDYQAVMNAWTTLPKELSSPTSDIRAKAANIDLFSKNGGWSSESSVKRSMDKNHLQKLRSHQINRRPRCKGRFVKKPCSSVCYDET